MAQPPRQSPEPEPKPEPKPEPSLRDLQQKQKQQPPPQPSETNTDKLSSASVTAPAPLAAAGTTTTTSTITISSTAAVTAAVGHTCTSTPSNRDSPTRDPASGLARQQTILHNGEAFHGRASHGQLAEQPTTEYDGGGAATNGDTGAATATATATTTTIATTSFPLTPEMSNPPQPPGPPRQPPVGGGLGYAGPSPYPPPTMGPPQYGYASANPGGGEMYRGSPTGAPSPLSLPSMRTLDPPQHTQPAGVPMGVPMAPGAAGAPMTPYYGMPPPYGMHPPVPPPYSLPMSDPRLSFGSVRHKKEIKRRTKTGCLTCRKRRIKCDETHPTCNNCKKSKRECAGYDPIFKQQQQQHHHQAQGSSTTTQSSAGTSGASASNSAGANSSTGALSPPSTTAVSAAASSPVLANSYGNQLPLPPVSSYPLTFAPSAIEASTGSIKQERFEYSPGAPLGQKTPAYDFSAAIDPALESATPKLPAQEPSGTDIKAKEMKVDELIALGGPAPPSPASPVTRETIEEITKIYYDVYVPGLGTFFETAWYNFKPQGSNPVGILLNNKNILDLLAAFLEAISSIRSTEPKDMVNTGVLETRVVWALASLVYTTPAAINPPRDDPVPADDAIEARNRLAVFETLLSGGSLTSNPCVPSPKNGGTVRIREFEFWWWLAEYLRLQDTPQTDLASQRAQVLSRMRNLLDGRENRDVLYSIAILRELSPKHPQGYEADLPQHLDETDPRSKLAVATRFVRSEAVASGGTTNVVRRFAELALKAYVNPGVNINRRA